MFCQSSICRDAAEPCCTTEVLDTHKTEARRILYRWHPLCGAELAISGKCMGHGTVMFICRISGTRMLAPLEVPAWMFDSAVYCRFVSAPSARVDMAALSSLQALLNEVSRPAAVVKAQHHSTVFGGFDAARPQFIVDSTADVSGEYSKSTVASQRQTASPRFAGQAPAQRKPAVRKPEGSAR